jgi:hypothetical protein
MDSRDILLIILVIAFFYNTYELNKIKTKENFVTTTTEQQIDTAVKRIYLADVEAIRLLSNFAIQLSQGGTTVPGNVTFSGDIGTNDANINGCLRSFQPNGNPLSLHIKNNSWLFNNYPSDTDDKNNNLGIRTWNNKTGAAAGWSDTLFKFNQSGDFCLNYGKLNLPNDTSIVTDPTWLRIVKTTGYVDSTTCTHKNLAAQNLWCQGGTLYSGSISNGFGIDTGTINATGNITSNGGISVANMYTASNISSPGTNFSLNLISDFSNFVICYLLAYWPGASNGTNYNSPIYMMTKGGNNVPVLIQMGGSSNNGPSFGITYANPNINITISGGAICTIMAFKY